MNIRTDTRADVRVESSVLRTVLPGSYKSMMTSYQFNNKNRLKRAFMSQAFAEIKDNTTTFGLTSKK